MPTPHLNRLSWFLLTLTFAVSLCPLTHAGRSSPTTTVLTVSSNSVPGQTPVTLTATVTGAVRGQVLFCDHSKTLCDGAALYGSGWLTSNHTVVIKMFLGVGSYSIYAKYLGASATAGSSSSPQTITVTAAQVYSTTTTIASPTGSPGNYTLSATVTGFGKTLPNGSVSFLNTSNNNIVSATATLDPATRGFTFFPSVDSPLAGPFSEGFVAAGDFNKDGIPDLAVVQRDSPGTVSVYLGVGDGTFGSATVYDVGNSPPSVTIADVNADGNLDLLVPNQFDATVSILLGNGDGTFQPQLTTGTALYPIFVAVGDFNHDGFADIATADYDDDEMGIHLGNGDGTFQTEVIYSVNSPWGIVVGDFNDDGIPDVATTILSNPMVQIFLGNGDGTFQSAQDISLPGPVGAWWLASGDLRNNGRSDLVVADFNNPDVLVLLSNGDGTFASPATVAVANNPWGASLGDVNNDGILDIVVPDTGADGQVSVLLGNGDGTFAAHTDYDVGNNPTWAALADFNGDGLLDIATSSGSQFTTSILLQAQFASATATGVAVYGNGTQQVLANFPGDGERTASQSSTVGLTGTPPSATTTALSGAPNPAPIHQTVVLIAIIAPIPSGSSRGTVSFYNGETLLGSSAVDSSGHATLTTTELPAGTNSLTAVYSGNGPLAASTSSVFHETITPQTATATILAVSPNPANSGEEVTLTASVSPAPSGSSLGTISFYNVETLLGTASIDSTGKATFSSKELPTGVLSLTAIYSGNTGFAGSTSAPFVETINSTYTVAAPQTPVTATEGGSVQVDVTVPPLGGSFDNPVTLSATGLPPGATATFNPPVVTPGKNGAPTVMTIQLAALAGGFSGVNRSRTGSLFLFGSMLMAGVLAGRLRRRPLFRNYVRGLALSVLACVVISQSACNGGFLGAPTTSPGSYVVTITGTSGSLHASTTVTVVVQ